jgi:hypothetical protein
MNNSVASFEQHLQRELARVIVGAEDVVRALCIALIARGLDGLVLLSLANHANKETAVAFPSQRLISQEAGVALGTVSDCIQRLIGLGEVALESPGGPRR